MRVARTNAKSDTPGIVSTRALIRRCAVALAQHLGRNCHFPRHSPKAMCGNMCGLPQHAVLGSQHSGAAGAVIVAALNSPKGKKKNGVLFFVFAVWAKKNWGAVLSSRKAKKKNWVAVLSSRKAKKKKWCAVLSSRKAKKQNWAAVLSSP